MVHSWLDTWELDYVLWHASDLACFAFTQRDRHLVIIYLCSKMK